MLTDRRQVMKRKKNKTKKVRDNRFEMLIEENKKKEISNFSSKFILKTKSKRTTEN